jgi:hypothetical protein
MLFNRGGRGRGFEEYVQQLISSVKRRIRSEDKENPHEHNVPMMFLCTRGWQWRRGVRTKLYPVYLCFTWLNTYVPVAKTPKCFHPNPRKRTDSTSSAGQLQAHNGAAAACGSSSGAR